MVAGKVSLATFANPSGLQLNGRTIIPRPPTPAIQIRPGNSRAGGLKSSALGNVQRGCPAGCRYDHHPARISGQLRIITVSDSMLEELINLKR